MIKHYHGSHGGGQTGGVGGNRNANRNGIKLEKNDIVKFGRVRLRVRDIDTGGNSQQEAGSAS